MGMELHHSSVSIKNRGHMNSAKQQALVALISSPTIREASRKSGVAERTINEYMRTDPEFRKAYEENRQGIVREASERMANAFTSAVTTLTDITNDKEVNPSTRVRSATAILEYGLKLWETTDIIQRIMDIEARLDER